MYNESTSNGTYCHVSIQTFVASPKRTATSVSSFIMYTQLSNFTKPFAMGMKKKISVWNDALRRRTVVDVDVGAVRFSSQEFGEEAVRFSSQAFGEELDTFGPP